MNPSGKLRALLVQSALLIRLDTQELESFNSILKVTIGRGGNNRMSLELLCSRACLRKVVAMGSGGATRVKDVKPFAASLARSVYLHYDDRHTVLRNPERWRPNARIEIVTPDSSVYNPSLSPEQCHAWALPFNRQFAKCVKLHNKTSKTETMIVLVVPKGHEDGWHLWLACAPSRNNIMMLPLQDASTGDIGECVHLDETKMQTMSLSVIGSLYEYVHDVAKAAKEKKSVSWAAPKVLIYTHCEICF